MAPTVKLTVDYDDIGDVLYIFEGEPYDTINVDVADQVVMRLDPKTHKVVGAMMHNVSLLVEAEVDAQIVRVLAQALHLQIQSLNRLVPDLSEALAS